MYLLGCVLLILTGCSQSISSKNSTDMLEQVFCIKLPVSDFLSYPAAYLPSQYLSKENIDPKVIERVDNESRKIWKEIHTKMQLTTPYIPIVVYGSLMNPISAQNTLQEYHPHANIR
ncbi:putative lipo domain protein [Chlamydia psittaci M56]|nr:putative lipo domain protein [Chlamydia psittaci M56]